MTDGNFNWVGPYAGTSTDGNFNWVGRHGGPYVEAEEWGDRRPTQRDRHLEPCPRTPLALGGKSSPGPLTLR